MATWSYDGFPLKRADASTPGDDYQYVIQSLDASIRHVFGIPTGVSLTPAFSIDSDGAVEILKSLSIGTEVLIDEIVDSIPTSIASDEDEQIATVNAIRAFIAEYVLNFLTDQDTFVEKAGDTMTGQLIANGGITGAGYLEIQNARFGGAQHPTLDYGTILQADNNTYDLIKHTDGVVVGDNSAVLHLAGSQPRASYRSQQLCFLSDLVDYITDGSGLDYVPVLGGTFIGQVAFDSLIGLNQTSGFAAYDVGLDSYTTVMSIEYNGNTPEYLRFWNISSIFNGQTKLGWAFADVNFGIFNGANITIGDVVAPLYFLGDGTRPYFNGDAIALLSEVGGSYLAGDGIAITALGGDVYSVALEANGITEVHMPAGNPGEYARLDAGGVLVFENLDLVAGTGIALVEVAGEFTISIDDLGVDTLQLAADAVDGTKIADDAIGVEHIDASGTLAAGTTYSLTVTDDAGNADTIVQEIRVAEPVQSLPDPDTATQLPIASFVVSPSRPAVGDAVSFNGTASLDLDGRIVSFAWDFNEDGITDSAAPIAQYSFSSPGVRNVTLTVTDDSGNSTSVTVPIDVAPQASPPVGVIPPIADFAYAPARPEPGDVVQFNATLSADPDGQVVAFAWDFNEDGIIDSTAAIVDHVFPEAGLYNVSLIVTDNSGSTDTLTLQVVVGSPEDDSSPPPPSSGLPPIAAFEYSPVNPRVSGPVRFQATLSTDPDGRITSYAWDFDGDGTIDSEAAIAEYVFLSEGVVDVSLTVTDDSGNTDTLTQQIVVDAEASQEPYTSLPPVADFEISPVSPVAGQLVLFNGLLSSDADGAISAYEWDFNGDGVVDSTDAFAEYVFPSAGTYNVALTVTDDSGNSDTFIRAILVDTASSAAPPPSSFQPPVADFTYMPSQPAAGELVLFNGTSSWDFDGEIVAYSWDFNGDGQPDATTATAEHIFPQPGTMVVSLTVTDNSGASDTLGLPIEVQ